MSGQTVSNTGGSNGLSDQLHVATVVDNNDPKHWGRIRARVDHIFEGIPDEHLPWAIVSLSHPGGGAAAHGHFDVPEVGAKVLVQFQNGSPLHPIYKGYFIDETTKLPEAEVNYPKRTVTLWPSGSLLIIDKQSNDVFVRNQGDLHLYVTGDAYIKVDGNLLQEVVGNRMTFVGGDDMTVVGGTHGVYSAEMKLKASGQQAISAGGNQTLYAGGNSTRDAGGLIHDDAGAGDAAGSAPSKPAFPNWPGVRGSTP